MKLIKKCFNLMAMNIIHFQILFWLKNKFYITGVNLIHEQQWVPQQVFNKNLHTTLES